MKLLLALLLTLGLLFGGIFLVGNSLNETNEVPVDYTGKCFNESNIDPFINSIKIKITHKLSENNYNVVIYSTKKPETLKEIFMLSQVQQYNNSWISSDQLKEFMNEVPCD